MKTPRLENSFFASLLSQYFSHAGHPPILKPRTLVCQVCKEGFWTIYGRDRHARSTHGNGAKDSNAKDGAASKDNGKDVAPPKIISYPVGAGVNGVSANGAGNTAKASKAPANASKAPEVDLTEEKENGGQRGKKGLFGEWSV